MDAVRADNFVFRVNPEESVKVIFYVTKFGFRASVANVAVGFDRTIMRGQATQGAVPGPQAIGVPQSSLLLGDWKSKVQVASDANGQASLDVNDSDIPPVIVITDENGMAKLSITGCAPEKPRVYIDGHVYGLRYGVGDTPPPVGTTSNASEVVNVLLFDKYDVPEKPSWILHIAPIFQQYANLYPAMERIVNLADYASCMTRLSPLQRASMPS